MKYLCLVYVDEKKLDALSSSESDALDGDALAYDEELRKSGHYIVSNALQSVNTATTIRLRKGKERRSSLTARSPKPKSSLAVSF